MTSTRKRPDCESTPPTPPADPVTHEGDRPPDAGSDPRPERGADWWECEIETPPERTDRR